MTSQQRLGAKNESAKYSKIRGLSDVIEKVLTRTG
jgi:hypothetical protein